MLVCKNLEEYYGDDLGAFISMLSSELLTAADKIPLQYPFEAEYDRDDPFAWLDGSVCAQTDAEAFFPGFGDIPFNAKKVCAACDVGAQCLQFAVKNHEEFGVWAGYSARELQNLIKKYGDTIDEDTARRLYQAQRAKIVEKATDLERRRAIRDTRPKKRSVA